MKFFLAVSLLVASVSFGTSSQLWRYLPAPPQAVPQGGIESRITHGEVAKPGQFPYQAGLSLQMGNGSAWCGGTLLNERWILTAAHCTDGVDSVIAFLGAHNITNAAEKEQQRIQVAKKNIFVHQKWDASTLTNDISLIKLPVKIAFNEFIQPAVLPAPNSNYEGKSVWASGWGKDSDSATSVSSVMRYVNVPVMSDTACNRYYFGATNPNQICISTKGGKSTCNGDSGGPLVSKEGGKNIVIGATSFGLALGCEVGWPGVFTRVSSYLVWINEITGGITNA